MFFKYLSLPVFLVSFALGIFFVYILGPEEKIIYMYPTPSNINKVLYKDGLNECYKYKAVQTKCPLNPLDIKTVPIQV